MIMLMQACPRPVAPDIKVRALLSLLPALGEEPTTLSLTFLALVGAVVKE